MSAHPRCRGWPAGSGARRTAAAAAGGTSEREPAPRRGRPSRRCPAAPSRRRSAHGAAAPPQRCPLGPAQDGTGRAGSADALAPSAPVQPPPRLGRQGAGMGRWPRAAAETPPTGRTRRRRVRGTAPPEPPGAGEQRVPHRQCPLRQPAMPVRGSGGSAVLCQAPLEPARGDGEHQSSPQQSRVTVPKPTHGAQSRKSRDLTRVASLRGRLTPGQVSKNATNSVMEPTE